jgi:hypothetical protein
MLSQSHKTGAFVLFLSISILLILAGSVSPAKEQEQPLGELKIEGSHIERLVLKSKDGQTKIFNNPDQAINLPVDEYRLMEVDLKGGYSCRIRKPLPDHALITVHENKQNALKVGAPLKQTINVKRQGSLLVMDYHLKDISGLEYANTNIIERPHFNVYIRNKKIASEEFEYG